LVLYLLFLVPISLVAASLGCGQYGPAQWFNSGINNQLTLQYAAPVLTLESNSLPFLYGCRPTVASTPYENITFTYNTEGFVSFWRHGAENYNASYAKQSDSNFYLASLVLRTDEALTLTARYDASGRIAALETDQGYSSGYNHMKSPLNSLSSLTNKRAVQDPVGDVNFHYQGTYPQYASSVDIGYQEVIELNQKFDYGIANNTMMSTNVTITLENDPSFLVLYQYYYAGDQLSYYCVNGCNQVNVSFTYDSKGRFTGAMSNQDQYVTVTYDTGSGNPTKVQFADKTWQLSY